MNANVARSAVDSAQAGGAGSVKGSQVPPRFAKRFVCAILKIDWSLQSLLGLSMVMWPVPRVILQ